MTKSWYNNILRTLLIFHIVNSCISLYEDQIGKFDWKKDFVGVPNNVLFDTTVSLGKHVLVQSEQNVVACLGAKNGQVLWRKVFAENDGNIVGSYVFSGSIISVSSTGVVYSWEINSGLLNWEANLANEDFEPLTKVDIAMMDLGYSVGKSTLILSRRNLYVIEIPPDNDPITKVFALNIADDSDFKLLLNTKEHYLAIILELNQGSFVSSQIFNMEEMELDLKQQIPATWMDDVSKVVLLKEGKLVYFSKDSESFFVINILKGKEVAQELTVNAGIESNIVSMKGIDSKEMNKLGDNFVVVHADHSVSNVRLNDDNSFTLASKLTFDSSPKIHSANVANENYFFSITQLENTINIAAFNSNTKVQTDDLTLRYQLPEETGGILSVYINMFLKRSSSIGFRGVLVSAGGSVVMLTQPSRIAWQREEALSEITSAEMLDLPLSDLAAKIEAEFQQSEELNIFEMFLKRMEAQVQQLQTFALKFSKDLHAGTLFQSKSKDPLIQEEDMIRDQFSLHKMLVLVTQKGKVFGVDSLSGKIVWQFYIKNIANAKTKFFVQRTTAHFPNPPRAILLSSGTNTAIVVFNPITGKIEQKENLNLNANILHCSLLPWVDSTHLKPLIIMDKNLKVHLQPDTEEIKAKFNSYPNPFYIYTAGQQSMTGYRILPGLKVVEAWSLSFPENQHLANLAGKNFGDRVNSVGRPLADRSVIYKYINPNAVAVITESVDKNIDKASITLYLIDAITGNVIHSVVHKKSSSPVHIVHSENWLVYSYRATKSRRFEISSIELYEGSSMFNSSAFSSFQIRPEPLVMQQAYILPGNINAMGVSRTEKGLTSRQILLGLSRGVVLGLPRRFFDPRRPLIQEQKHKEEGLIQYAPEIPLPTEMFLNYNQSISKIRAIYTCSSALESTSIVFVTGLDLFFTRTQPSKMFDVLKEDFDYILIGTVLIGMLVATFVTRKLSQNKKLNKAWK